MGHAVKLLFADPGAEFLADEHGVWVVSAERPGAVRSAIGDATTLDDATDRLAAVAEDATVVRVVNDGSRGYVGAYRSVTATRSVYLCRGSDGATVVTDAFRNALAHVAPGERQVSRRALADHLLFREPIEPLTYVDGVRELEQGARCRWSDRGAGWESDLVDVLAPAPSGGDATERIGAALSEVVADGVEDGARTMLSGGVDSTLLATYLDDPAPVVMDVDSPEFAAETENAERALELLDVAPHRRMTVAESSFRDRLEASVDALGFPSHYNQTVVTDAAFREAGAGQFLNGEGADALFGLQGTKEARIADWCSPLLSRRVADALADRERLDRAADQYGTLVAVRDRLDRPPEHPESFANNLAFYTDPASVGAVLDDGLVRRRFRRQHGYVRERVPLPDAGVERHLALGHLASFLRHNTTDQWRQLGYVHGQTLFAPFATRTVARAALSVPARTRYIRGLRGVGSLTTKHHLKSLLAERLPDYPVGQEKGNGALPVERYHETGPLDGVFERYEPSSLLGEAAARHVESWGPITWPLLTLAVWRDRVLHANGPELVPGTRRRHVRVPSAPPSPSAV